MIRNATRVSLRKWILTVSIPLISGCQLVAAPVAGVMTLANKADQASWAKQAKRVWDGERAYVRELQARGDPFGDYLYALGNAQGWIQDTQDPATLLSLFQKAVDKGSSDAEIVLGIYYFTGNIPIRHSGDIWLSDAQINRSLGEKLVRSGIKKKCTYAEPVPNKDYVSLRYVSGAQWMYYEYRDGIYGIDKSGKYFTIVPKHTELEREWHEMNLQCEASGLATGDRY